MLTKLLILCLAVSSQTFAMEEGAKDIRDDATTKSRRKDEELSCPRSCRCPNPEKVDCSDAKLRSVPHTISRDAVYLLLNENRLSEITPECFKNCPRVRTLNLQGNKLSDRGISDHAFEALPHLQYLYLSKNKLKKTPARLPHGLISLNLEGNSISEVDESSFEQKTRMKHLYLHDNKLTVESLHSIDFSNMTRVQEVTLSNNKLTAIPNLPHSVEWLHLRGNKITGISENTFQHNRRLLALYLQNNDISNEDLYPASFTGLKKLEALDLSENRLTKIPEALPKELKVLDLKKNAITGISRGSLDHLKELEYLLLQYNMLNTSEIDAYAFAKLRKLQVLHVFSNRLTEIPTFLPRKLKSLVMLSNDITKIKKRSFARNRRLEDLNLRYNQLTNTGIERGSLRPLPQLATIDLTGNQLKAVPSLPKNVESVFLAKNRIVRIPAKSLTRLTRLRHLSLKENRLKEGGIPDNAFPYCISLKVLDLSSNLLTSVPQYLPPNLEHLNLRNNQISMIGEFAFISAPLLKDIFLEENMLLPDRVSLKAFHALRFLQRVDINWRPRRAQDTYRKRRHTKRDWSAYRNDVFRPMRPVVD